MGSGTQLALFAAIVGVFSLMGAVFWRIGQRELDRQREAAQARQQAAIADAVAIFELAAAADRAVLDAGRRELEPGPTDSEPGPSETVVAGEPRGD